MAVSAGGSFKYVYIPADISEPLQQLELPVPEGKEVECLLDRLKQHFAGSGQKNETQKAAHRKALLESLGKNAEGVNADLLEAATNMQLVENVALLTNSPATGYIGVNLYCDDEGNIKDLPVNVRASDIATCCGKQLQIHGDAFIARVFDNDDDFRRHDFLLSELSSSAPWVRQAHDLNSRAHMDKPRTEQFLENLQQKKEGKATPTPAEAEKELGNQAFKKGLWEDAVMHYSNAIKCDAGMLTALNNRALAYLKLGKARECMADCDGVLASEPENAKAWLRRAAAKEQLGQLQEALHDFEHVLSQQPGNKEALEATGRIKQAVAQAGTEQVHAGESMEQVQAMAQAGTEQVHDGQSMEQVQAMDSP